jgi:hypothetical protein
MSINVIPISFLNLSLVSLVSNINYNGYITIGDKRIYCGISYEPIIETTSKTYYNLITGEPYKYIVFKEPKQRWRLRLLMDLESYLLNNDSIRNRILQLTIERGNTLFPNQNILRFVPEDGKTRVDTVGAGNQTKKGDKGFIIIEMEGAFLNTTY